LTLVTIDIKSFMQIMYNDTYHLDYTVQKLKIGITWVFLINKNFFFNGHIHLAFLYLFLKFCYISFSTYHLDCKATNSLDYTNTIAIITECTLLNNSKCPQKS